MGDTDAIPEIVAVGDRGVTVVGGDVRARILGTVLGIVLRGKTGIFESTKVAMTGFAPMPHTTLGRVGYHSLNELPRRHYRLGGKLLVFVCKCMGLAIVVHVDLLASPF